MSGGVYVAGWGSGAGKTTMCEALLRGALAKLSGPSQLGYIKPVTQCEAVTDVVEYCDRAGIEAIGIGPVVFQKGFTNTFIGCSEGSLAERQASLLRTVVEGVGALRARRFFTVVDGVGYPSVGSCCGVGNGDVAATLSLPVVLIAPNGLGDAIDTFELMYAYFTHKKANVVGVVFNKLKNTARHHVDENERIIRQYFAECHPNLILVGFVREKQTEAGDAAVVQGEEGEHSIAVEALRQMNLEPLWQRILPTE